MGHVNAAVEFLLARQARDGAWRDFLTLAGEATDWTTAYVASHLEVAGAAPARLRRAARALLRDQHGDGGWGYHAGVPTDGDSTAYALLFLGRRTTDRRALEAGVRSLLAHQDPASGGVATYRDPDPIRRYMGLPPSVSLAGWRQPHLEVTATAGRALAAVPDTPSDAIEAAWRFVRARQDDEGWWPAYWWATPLYSTLQAVALACARPELPGARRALSRAARWVVRAEIAGGGWASPSAPAASAPAASAFGTALAVSILAYAGGSDDALERGVAALHRLQQPSGEWPSGPILRIPPPGVVEPNDYDAWRTNRLGTGVVIRDQHSLFTTATCLGALALADAARRG